ncbi:MAG: hypothetical protein EOP45_13940 [Sphingobacteriaceae bacterium]|nr:MAG: hypothetical protein EOP45_13940 [Sphingobacteriaceae bacterium]
MSFKILASIRFLELQDLDLIKTPIFNITIHEDEKAKVIDDEFYKYAGLRDIQSYKKNALAYVNYESDDDNETFKQAMNAELMQRVWQIETFLIFLWFVKDNSVSLEQAYGQFTIAKGINWWTGRNVFSTCEGKFTNTLLSSNEVSKAVDLLLSYTANCIEKDPIVQKSESANKPLIQSGEFRSGLDTYKVENRIERAMSFLSSARSSPHLPQKVAHYVAILECLFGSEGSEIIHKVSERTAFYLADTKATRITIFNAIKEAYKVRSKFVHGDKPSKNYGQLCAISIEADSIVREVLKKVILNDYKTFLQKNLDQYFNELVF